MNIFDMEKHLAAIEAVNFRLPDGTYLPPHFHVTEIGLVTKHFIDCGGVERKETVASFQLWEAGDYDHRLAPQKFLYILKLSKKILGEENLPIEVEYQQNTIGKFGLDFDGRDFVLVPKQTACLAQDACGIPNKTVQIQAPSSGCCPSVLNMTEEEWLTSTSKGCCG